MSSVFSSSVSHFMANSLGVIALRPFPWRGDFGTVDGGTVVVVAPGVVVVVAGAVVVVRGIVVVVETTVVVVESSTEVVVVSSTVVVDSGSVVVVVGLSSGVSTRFTMGVADELLF